MQSITASQLRLQWSLIKIALNLPINAVQNFTYKLMQNGVELQAGEVTLPALAQEVSIPFTPNTAGEVVATVSVGAGTLGNFVNCDNCTASFFVTSSPAFRTEAKRS